MQRVRKRRHVNGIDVSILEPCNGYKGEAVYGRKSIERISRRNSFFLDNQIIQIILYGFYANGTYTSESDVDVALLLQGTLDKKKEEQLSELIVTLNLKYDKVFFVINIDYSCFQKWKKVTPFYKNVKQGIVLWKAV